MHMYSVCRVRGPRSRNVPRSCSWWKCPCGLLGVDLRTSEGMVDSVPSRNAGIYREGSTVKGTGTYIHVRTIDCSQERWATQYQEHRIGRWKTLESYLVPSSFYRYCRRSKATSAFCTTIRGIPKEVESTNNPHRCYLDPTSTHIFWQCFAEWWDLLIILQCSV